MAWTPLGSDPKAYDVLVEGIPVWMQASVEKWVRSLVESNIGLGLLEDFDIAARSLQPFAPFYEVNGWGNFWHWLSVDERLRLVDFLISRLARSSARTVEIERILARGGSAWTVGSRGGHIGLERRVPEAVAEAAEAAMAAGQAGDYLSEAWSAAFGTRPNSSTAYSRAIKAVEEAAIPVVQPKHAKATLGTVIGQMRGDGDWKLPIDGSSGDTVVGLCSELWSGQTDRHGSNGSTPPTQEAAEAAVTMAVSLVQWFSSGAVQRR